MSARAGRWKDACRRLFADARSRSSPHERMAARNLVELVKRLDLDELSAENDVAQLAEALKRFCGMGSSVIRGDSAASMAPTPTPQ